MKREHLNWVLALVLAGSAVIISAQTLASVESQTAAAKKAMSGVPVPEMAAKAVRLVSQASVEDREVVALAAVEFVAQKHPAATKSVVSSISRFSPSLAAKVAAKAAKLLPHDSIGLACAAALGARQCAPEVASVVAKSYPKLAPDVAERVMLAVPEAAAMTSEAVAAAVPTEKAAIPTVESSSQASMGLPVIIQRKKGGTPPTSVTGQDTPGFDYARPR